MPNARPAPASRGAAPNTVHRTGLPRRPAKRWWHSRTLWFNALCAGLAAAEAGFGALAPLLPVNVYGMLAFVLPLGNALLRVLTTRPLTAQTGRQDQS